MEATKILTANLIDIVFDGRNKAYGAYELRRNYEKRVWYALAITTAIVLITAGGAWLKTAFAKPEKLKVKKIIELNIANAPKPEEKLPELPPPPPAKKIEMPKVQTIKLTTPIVTKDVVVEPPPTQADLVDAKISHITQEGIKSTGIVMPPENVDSSKGILVTKSAAEDNNRPFAKVEIEAEYNSGAKAWKSFLERNLQGDVPIDNNAAPGIYTVIVQFVVDVQGNVSNIIPLTKFGHGMEAEAVRVIKKSGKWKPAIQNGREVTAYRKQPITFQVLEQ